MSITITQKEAEAIHQDRVKQAEKQQAEKDQKELDEYQGRMELRYNTQ